MSYTETVTESRDDREFEIVYEITETTVQTDTLPDGTPVYDTTYEQVKISETEIVPIPFINRPFTNDFIENQWGWAISHSDTGTFVMRMTPPNGLGDYKLILAYASTVAGNSVECDLRIGAWNFVDGLVQDKYIPTTAPFYLDCSEAMFPLKYRSPTFTINKRAEMLVIRLRKTNNSGSGDFYILAGMLIKQ